jgi:hypothetical protein
MGLQVDPPFGLGQTWFSLGSGESIKNDSYHGIQSSALYGDNFTGAVKEFTDVNPITGQVRTNRRKVCVAVKNASTVALAPKRVVRFSLTAGKLFSEVDGYSAATSEERVGVVDEWLPASGVTVGDIFWVTVDGPTEVAHALSGTNIAAGDRLAAITAAASTGTTAGRVTPNALADAAAGVGLLGYAVSAATSGSTPLCHIRTRFN